MGVRATELRKGTVIEKDGDLLLITEYKHHTPGNLRAIIQIKTKSLNTGSTAQMRLGSGDMLEVAFLDRKTCEYLYKDPAGGNFIFMDSGTYEQLPISAELIGEQMGFVRENTPVTITFHGTRPIGLELPSTVVLKVVEAEPAAKGNTATNVKKEAVVETGLTVKVPPHVSPGDQVKIRTDDGEFLGRA